MYISPVLYKFIESHFIESLGFYKRIRFLQNDKIYK